MAVSLIEVVNDIIIIIISFLKNIYDIKYQHN